MLDELIKGGTVVDGTGAPAGMADVGIRDGRIVAVGADRRATPPRHRRHRPDRRARLRRPPHPLRRPAVLGPDAPRRRAVHGVTTVIGGNCGFTLAPAATRRPTPTTSRDDGAGRGHAPRRPRRRRRLGLGDLRRVPRPPRRAASAVNAGFLVGHCAIRRYVMGADSVGNEAVRPSRSTPWSPMLAPGPRGRRPRLLHHPVRHPHRRRRPAGAAAGGPTDDELLALCAETGRHEGTTLEAHHRRLPRPLRRRRDRAARPTSAPRPTARSTGTCSPSTPATPTGSPRQLVGLRPRPASRAAGWWRSPCRCSCP